MNKKEIKSSEKTWDTIAESFDSTRRKPWGECMDFIESLPKSNIVADIGSGNGRHLIPCARHCKNVVAFDISSRLLRITEKNLKSNNLKNAVLLHSNIVNLPVKDNTFDALIFIATLHNIQGRNNRVDSLKEINRILKKDGKAIISVWLRWQDNYRKYFIKKWFSKKKNEEFGDIIINWRQHGLDEPRFYHLYNRREFIHDLRSAGLKLIELRGVKYNSKKYFDNYFAIVKK